MSSRRLPLVQALRLQGPSVIWFKPALSVVVSAAPPNLLLLALGRLDLALYTMAGSLCALYGHQRPYAARARVLAGVVFGMTAGLAVALLASALTPGPVVLVLVGALLAAVQKTVCEATRVGPPGNVVVTFVSSAALFVPQTPGQVPAHLGLALAAGAWAWLVCMAPGVFRPHGPERRAVAAALHAVADQEHAPAHAALRTAWQALRSPGTRPDPTRRALENLLLSAETADADPGRLRAWARALRGTGPVPRTETTHQADAHPRPARVPFTHLAPIATRTALGCALAGLAALSLGVGRPYWALVTAASLYQANVTLTWSRGVQRVVGNLLGVLVFAALTPLTHLHPVTLVLCCLACSFGAEALIARNYWLGTVCVTPMALLITEFTHLQDPGVLITQRVLDTLVGALAGFAAAVIVTNRRAGDRVHDALTALEEAGAHTERLLAHPAPCPADGPPRPRRRADRPAGHRRHRPGGVVAATLPRGTPRARRADRTPYARGGGTAPRSRTLEAGLTRHDSGTTEDTRP